MSDISTRIKQRMREEEVRATDIVRITGASKGAVSQWVNGGTQPSGSNLLLLSSALKCDPQWLATGEGPKIKVNQGVTLFELFRKAGEQVDNIYGEDRELFDDDFEITPEMEERIREIERANQAESLFVESNLISEQFAKIKKFDVELSAGHGASVGEESANSFLYFRKDWLERKELDEKNLCIVYVKGHSMEPTINDQEVILVDSSEYYTHRENVDDGFIYAISVDGEAMVKRLFKKPGGGLIVRSDSPAPQYRDMILEGADLDYLRIIGRAIWHAGDL